jgi:hypothetical protein
MAATPPTSVPPVEPNLEGFFNRRTNGTYATMAEQLIDMGVHYLGEAEPGVTLHRGKVEWAENKIFLDDSGEEAHVSIFGEIMASAHGTALGAAGDHQWETKAGQVRKDSHKDRPRILTSRLSSFLSPIPRRQNIASPLVPPRIAFL